MANEGYTSCEGLISATLPAEIFFLVFKAVDALLYPCIRLLIHSKACLQVKATLPNITVRCAPEVGGLIETGSSRNDNMTSSSSLPIPQTYSANNLSVDELAATYFIAFTMLLYTPAVFLGCFCGAWSDTVGRKLPALAGCTGIVLTIVVYLLSIAVDSGPLTTLTLILIGAGIQGSFGDSAMVSMAIYSYVSDLTTSESRTRVLGRLLGMNFFGCVLGLVLIGALLDTAGFSVTLYVALLLMCTCWFICATFMQGQGQPCASYPSCPCKPTTSASIEDGTGQRREGQEDATDGDGEDAETGHTPPVPFHLKYVTGSIAVFARKRQGNRRRHIGFFAFIVLLHQLCRAGETDCILLYVAEQPLLWSRSSYAFFLAADYALLGIFVSVLLPVILKCPNQPSDVSLVLIGVVFKVCRLVLTMLATNTWQMYASILIGCPSILIVTGAKSILSKAVDAEDIGKMFSMISCGETVCNLFGSVLFVSIYRATVEMYPGLVFVLDTAVNLLLLGVVWYVMRHGSRDDNQQPMALPACSEYGTLKCDAKQ